MAFSKVRSKQLCQLTLVEPGLAKAVPKGELNGATKDSAEMSGALVTIQLLIEKVYATDVIHMRMLRRMVRPWALLTSQHGTSNSKATDEKSTAAGQRASATCPRPWAASL